MHAKRRQTGDLRLHDLKSFLPTFLRLWWRNMSWGGRRLLVRLTILLLLRGSKPRFVTIRSNVVVRVLVHVFVALPRLENFQRGLEIVHDFRSPRNLVLSLCKRRLCCNKLFLGIAQGFLRIGNLSV